MKYPLHIFVAYLIVKIKFPNKILNKKKMGFKRHQITHPTQGQSQINIVGFMVAAIIIPTTVPEKPPVTKFRLQKTTKWEVLKLFLNDLVSKISYSTVK